MRLSCKASRIVLASTLALCLGIVPLVGCGSGGSAADDTAATEEELVEEEVEEPAEEEAPIEEEAVDEAVWVRKGSTSTYLSSEEGAEPLVATTTHELDDAGNIVSTTTSSEGREDVVVTRVNDEYGWEISETYAGEDGKAYEYTNELDEAGRVVHITSGESSTDITYDADGNCICREVNSVSYQVDEDGNRIEGSEESTHTVVTFNANGFISSRERDSGRKAVYKYAYEYGDDGLPTTCVTTLFVEDQDGNMPDEPQQTETRTFTYDENGNVVRIETTSEYGTSTIEYECVLIEHPSLAATYESRLISF